MPEISVDVREILQLVPLSYSDSVRGCEIWTSGGIMTKTRQGYNFPRTIWEFQMSPYTEVRFGTPNDLDFNSAMDAALEKNYLSENEYPAIDIDIQPLAASSYITVELEDGMQSRGRLTRRMLGEGVNVLSGHGDWDLPGYVAANWLYPSLELNDNREIIDQYWELHYSIEWPDDDEGPFEAVTPGLLVDADVLRVLYSKGSYSFQGSNLTIVIRRRTREFEELP